MNQSVENPFAFNKNKDYLVCIDSDGCAFDTMEIKHKECFAPNFIKYFDLQPVSEYAQEVWEFVNLYSVTRGCNRFLAVIKSLDLLFERPEVISLGYNKPDITSLRHWVETETKLSNPVLEAACEYSQDPVLIQTLKWSIAVNQSVSDHVKTVQPFPYVQDVLEKAISDTDIMVVSATPKETLDREWDEQGFTKYLSLIAGQEMGTKSQHIAYAKAGRYEDNKVIKLGDAMGDLLAAQANQVHFFPIIPGHEQESWKRFLHEGLDKFIQGEYTRDYEDDLINDFKLHLPVIPTWTKILKISIQN